jgi:hypothetical protein
LDRSFKAQAGGSFTSGIAPTTLEREVPDGSVDVEQHGKRKMFSTSDWIQFYDNATRSLKSSSISALHSTGMPSVVLPKPPVLSGEKVGEPNTTQSVPDSTKNNGEPSTMPFVHHDQEGPLLGDNAPFSTDTMERLDAWIKSSEPPLADTSLAMTAIRVLQSYGISNMSQAPPVVVTIAAGGPVA